MSMKESTIKVDGLLTALCARNVEKALMKMPGVHHASANTLNSTATVHYDESQVSLAQLQAAVADCGYVCAGEALPEHMQHAGHAEHAAAMPMDAGAHAAHAGHMAAATPAMDHTVHAGHAMPAAAPVEHVGHVAAGPVEDHSAHGGRPGMTAAEMERDMRNRFFVSLVLTVPVFLFSHLATQILGLHIPLPFGIDDKVFGFILTTPVVLYGAWPFYVGARNGLR